MTPTAEVVQWLESWKRRGLHFRWSTSGVEIVGQISLLSGPDCKFLAERQEVVKTIVAWNFLMEDSAQRFGSVSARVYPFCYLNGPALTYSPMGPGKIVQVLNEEYCQFQLQDDSGKPAHVLELRARNILPPSEPPPSWLLAAVFSLQKRKETP